MDQEARAKKVDAERQKAAEEWANHFYNEESDARRVAATAARAIMDIKGFDQTLFLPRTRLVEDLKFWFIESIDMIDELEAIHSVQISQKAQEKIKTVDDLVALIVGKLRRRAKRKKKASK